MGLHLDPPFRAEHLGSLKRPIKLHEKRKAFETKQCTQEELTALEDEAINSISTASRTGSATKKVSAARIAQSIFLEIKFIPS